MILLLVMTDGRRTCIERTVASARESLTGPITRAVIHDDSGDPDYTEWLAEEFPDFELVSTAGRSGFGGAIRNAWLHLNATAENDDCRFVFHLEDDFTFNREVPLRYMATILDQHPELVQLALRRQPWNDTERIAGGVVEVAPTEFVENGDYGHAWLEHRRFFTTNPSLYRRSLTWRGWPAGGQSEGMFTAQLLEDPLRRFGYWGARASGEWVHHIGTTRAGTAY